ncbi:MAG: helix-turn-helix domain-containing protein [Phycicoccus sp.]
MTGEVSEAVCRWPAPALRGAIGGYQGFRQVGAPASHAGLPSPSLTMIVALDEPLVVAKHPDPRQAPGRYSTLVGGLHTAPATVTHDGRQSGIQLDLSPLGVRTLIGMPAAALAQLDVTGVEVFGRLADELHERVAAAGSWRQRFDVLDDVLGRRAASGGSGPGVPLELVRAWELLTRPAATPVAAVARDIGWSERHLRQRFRAEFGLGPAQASRVARFDRARRDVGRRATADLPLDLATVAVAHGYYDQAHLAAAFREFAGAAPSRWAVRELRYLQADVHPDEAR